MKHVESASGARALGLCSLIALASACSAAGGGTPPTELNPSGGSGGTGAGEGNAGSSGASGEGGSGDLPVSEPAGDPTQLCGESEVGSSGLRRLSRRELESSVR